MLILAPYANSFATLGAELRMFMTPGRFSTLCAGQAHGSAFHRILIGRIAFWDNRCVQHQAIWDYWPNVRSGFRVQIEGTAPPVAG